MAKKKNKKTISYSEAPSGKVTFYNYKEPFMEYEAGYGFQGVLLMDADSGLVQCHLCGRWLQALNSEHLRTRHGITASEYKVEVGLNQSTALIGEAYRAKLVRNGLEQKKTLRKGRKKSKEEIEKIRRGLVNYRASMEGKNENGVCPAQLLERLRKLGEKLGRTPTHDELKGMVATLRQTYGTISNALQLAGFSPRKVGANINYKAHLARRPIYTKEKVLKTLRLFKEQHGREPSKSDMRRGILPSKTTIHKLFGSWGNAKKEAYA